MLFITNFGRAERSISQKQSVKPRFVLFLTGTRKQDSPSCFFIANFVFAETRGTKRLKDILYLLGYNLYVTNLFYTLWGIFFNQMLDTILVIVYNQIIMNEIATFIKQERKKAKLTQEEFAIRSGLGLRFIRELEQGKESVRMDKVNQALAMFGAIAVPGKLSADTKENN